MNEVKAVKLRGSVTTWSLAALAAGFGLGALGHATESRALALLAEAFRPVGALWLAALQMTVLPLVVAQLLAGIVGARGPVGGLAGKAILLFVAMLVAAAVFTLAVAPPILAGLPSGSLGAAVPATEMPPAAPVSFSDWVAGLLPRNLFAAALAGDILTILLFTAVLGLAITRLPAEQREPLAHAIGGLAAAMLTVVRWILWFTPLGVFALLLVLARTTGLDAAGLLAAFVVISIALLLAATGLLYPVTVWLGRTSFRAFARAAAPAQFVAAGTRSSIASLPALVQGGRDRMELPAMATGLVLPLGVSVFKLNRTITAPFKLLFLAHVLGIPLSAATIAAFVVTIVILSFGSPGVPSSGPINALPAYLAAGLPIEALVILEALDVIPDIFKTILNVTADMSAATILSRSSRAAGTVAAPLAETA
jgi:proton glutamate symport protein